MSNVIICAIATLFAVAIIAGWVVLIDTFFLTTQNEGMTPNKVSNLFEFIRTLFSRGG